MATVSDPQPSGCQRKCGGVATAGLPEDLRRKVANHPCYDEEAHHFYARMHIPVAPKCNIQCNFCNRRYDCANESRPGVTSRVLTPEQAANKVGVVAAAVPALSVVGIAGPGDPLANENPTFRALELVRQRYPDLRLCISTNGLMLPDFVERLAQLGVDHVTITINAVDPTIAAAIYRWVLYRRKPYRGEEGARILLDRQLTGLAMLAERGILCKVNSVLVPGINDGHLPEVSATIKAHGAFLHNIIPFIPCAGSAFGDAGIRGPRAAALLALQNRCAGGIQVMRHCRQCRADAIGLLQADRSAEFDSDYMTRHEVIYSQAAHREAHAAIELRRGQWHAAIERMTTTARTPAVAPGGKVLVAVATKGDGLVNQHFGHAEEFSIYAVDGSGLAFVGARKIRTNYCDGPSVCGNKDELLPDIIELLGDCKAILCSRIGERPRKALEAAGFACVETSDSIVTALANLSREGGIAA